jgi:hypothetical protein
VLHLAAGSPAALQLGAGVESPDQWSLLGSNEANGSLDEDALAGLAGAFAVDADEAEEGAAAAAAAVQPQPQAAAVEQVSTVPFLHCKMLFETLVLPSCYALCSCMLSCLCACLLSASEQHCSSQ